MPKLTTLALGVAIAVYGAGGAIAADTAKDGAQKMTKTMTKAQCETLWNQARGGATGDLAVDKAKPYAPDFKEVDVNGDSKLSSTEWMDGCNKGLIRTAATTPAAQPGAPTSDRTPGKATPERTPGASNTGAAGTGKGMTPGGTSDRTPSKP